MFFLVNGFLESRGVRPAGKYQQTSLTHRSFFANNLFQLLTNLKYLLFETHCALNSQQQC